jgi:spore coat polysaccharide biosynthesis protein SpsF
MTVAVIVQARVNSSRLPGKVLLPLGTQSVLGHVLERCATIPGSDVLCCAVPEGTADDPVAAEAERCGARVFRGSENDVLDRYARAAAWLRASVVMRVTSDCPLIDPVLCGEVLAFVTRDGADYACNNLRPSWPHGLDCEAMKASWLARAAAEAKRPSEREHVTPFIRNHKECEISNLAGPGGEATEHRWTLDTPADLEFLTEMFRRLPEGPKGWSWRAAMAVVEADPGMLALNAGQDRYAGIKKSLAQDSAHGFAPAVQ